MQVFSVTGSPGVVNSKSLSPFYDGEGFAIDVEVRNRQRKPVDDLGLYDVYVTLSNNPGGSPPGTPNIIEYHLADEEAWVSDALSSTVRFSFRAEALTVLGEGQTYHFNVWSKRFDEDPDVQAVGSLTPILSIRAARMIEAATAPSLATDASFDPVAPVEGDTVTLVEPIYDGTAPITVSLDALTLGGADVLASVSNGTITLDTTGDLVATWSASNTGGTAAPHVVTVTVAAAPAEPGEAVAPTLNVQIPDQSVTAGEAITPIVLADHFSHSGAPITYSLVETIANISIVDRVVRGIVDAAYDEGPQTLRIRATADGLSTDDVVTLDITAPEIAPTINSLWVGATDQTSTTATVRTADSTAPVRLMASTTPDFAAPIYSDPVTPDADYFFARVKIPGLAADTTYHLAAEVGGARATNLVGKCKTPATSGDFSFCMASCANTDSNAIIFDTIRTQNPDMAFLLDMGDIHYRDIGVLDVGLFHAGYDGTLSASRRRNLWASFPVYYMWDDHDYGPNNSGASSPSKSAAIFAYRSRVPSPALATSSGAIYYTYDHCKVRFAVLDVRSERVSGAMISQAQEDWLINIAQTLPAGYSLCIKSTCPWISSSDNDTWNLASAQRTRIGNAIATAIPGRSFIVSGDAHMLAFDDGTNSAGGIPVLHAAPFDRPTSTKGGPYTTAPVTASTQQYGRANLTETASGHTLQFLGYSVNVTTGAQTERLNEVLTLAPPSAADVPAKMATPSVVSNAEGEFTATFTAPDDGGSAITRYDIQWSTDGTNWNGLTDVTSPVTVTGLAAGDYFVQVRAANAVGAGAYSGSGTVTVATTTQTAGVDVLANGSIVFDPVAGSNQTAFVAISAVMAPEGGFLAGNDTLGWGTYVGDGRSYAGHYYYPSGSTGHALYWRDSAGTPVNGIWHEGPGGMLAGVRGFDILVGEAGGTIRTYHVRGNGAFVQGPRTTAVPAGATFPVYGQEQDFFGGNPIVTQFQGIWSLAALPPELASLAALNAAKDSFVAADGSLGSLEGLFEILGQPVRAVYGEPEGYSVGADRTVTGTFTDHVPSSGGGSGETAIAPFAFARDDVAGVNGHLVGPAPRVPTNAFNFHAFTVPTDIQADRKLYSKDSGAYIELDYTAFSTSHRYQVHLYFAGSGGINQFVGPSVLTPGDQIFLAVSMDGTTTRWQMQVNDGAPIIGSSASPGLPNSTANPIRVGAHRTGEDPFHGEMGAAYLFESMTTLPDLSDPAFLSQFVTAGALRSDIETVMAALGDGMILGTAGPATNLKSGSNGSVPIVHQGSDAFTSYGLITGPAGSGTVEEPATGTYSISAHRETVLPGENVIFEVEGVTLEERGTWGFQWDMGEPASSEFRLMSALPEKYKSRNNPIGFQAAYVWYEDAGGTKTVTCRCIPPKYTGLAEFTLTKTVTVQSYAERYDPATNIWIVSPNNNFAGLPDGIPTTSLSTAHNSADSLGHGLIYLDPTQEYDLPDLSWRSQADRTGSIIYRTAGDPRTDLVQINTGVNNFSTNSNSLPESIAMIGLNFQGPYDPTVQSHPDERKQVISILSETHLSLSSCRSAGMETLLNGRFSIPTTSGSWSLYEVELEDWENYGVFLDKNKHIALVGCTGLQNPLTITGSEAKALGNIGNQPDHGMCRITRPCSVLFYNNRAFQRAGWSPGNPGHQPELKYVDELGKTKHVYKAAQAILRLGATEPSEDPDDTMLIANNYLEGQSFNIFGSSAGGIGSRLRVVVHGNYNIATPSGCGTAFGHTGIWYSSNVVVVPDVEPEDPNVKGNGGATRGDNAGGNGGYTPGYLSGEDHLAGNTLLYMISDANELNDPTIGEIETRTSLEELNAQLGIVYSVEGWLTWAPNQTVLDQTGPYEPHGPLVTETFGPAPLYDGLRHEDINQNIVRKTKYATPFNAAIVARPSTNVTYEPVRGHALDFYGNVRPATPTVGAIEMAPSEVFTAPDPDPGDGTTATSDGNVSTFRVTEQAYSSDAPEGATVSTIIDSEPAATYEVVGDVGGLYAIVGRQITRTAAPIVYSGQWHEIGIRQTVGANVGTRVVQFWNSPPGEDPLSGRLSIWSDFDECHQGERIETVLHGLTAKEEAIYHIESDWGDETEIFTSLPADHPGRIAGGVQTKCIRIHCPETTGTRTVTYRIYRPGQTLPAYTISKDIEVKPLSAIPSADTYVASRGGSFANAPDGQPFSGGSSLKDALTAAKNRNTTAPMLVYVKSGDAYAAGEAANVSLGAASGDAERRILVRVWGGTDRPVVSMDAGAESGGWRIGTAVSGTKRFHRLSIKGLEFVGRFDSYNITDPALDDGLGNHGYTHLPEDSILTGTSLVNVTLNDCKSLGMAKAITLDGQYSSACVYNSIIDEWSVYGLYIGQAEGGGIVGSRLEKLGLQPAVSKAIWNLEREDPNESDRANHITLNGPGRNSHTRRFAIINCEMAALHGWSSGNNSDQVDALYDYGVDENGKKVNIPKFQVLYRCSSNSAEPGFRFQITGNRFEGELSFGTGNESVHGRILISDNHWIWNGGASTGMGFQYWGAWICNNTIVVANGVPLNGNKLNLIAAPSDRSGSVDDPYAAEYGMFVLGNTIVDLRTDANLRGGETAGNSITELCEGITREGVERQGNVLVIPNRMVTETPASGVTLLTGLNGLDQTVVAQAKLAGLLLAQRADHNPYIAPALKPEFATPPDSGISARPLAGSALLDAWSFSDTDLIPVGRDGPYAGSSRGLGAYAKAG